jgi:hypothetical protein
MMNNVNGFLSADVHKAILKSINGQEATDSVRRMIEAIDSGAVVVVDAELFAPPALAGERMLTFRFHLKAL